MVGTSGGNSQFTPGVLLRVQYACYLFFGLILTMLLRSSLSGIFSHLSVLQKGCKLATSALSEDCTAEVLVYRVSFALALFSSCTSCLFRILRAASNRRHEWSFRNASFMRKQFFCCWCLSPLFGFQTAFLPFTRTCVSLRPLFFY
ncbi:putative serine incorporator [Trypanosoma cruzi]|nr:putative serine incorporator [Trypanosoma cruzi]